MLKKWFDKKAQKLGYMRLSDFEKYKQEMFNEVKDIARIRDDFNPRIKEIEKRNKQIFEANLGLNSKTIELEKNFKKYDPLFTAVAGLREDVSDIKEIWKCLENQEKILESIKEEQASIRTRLNQLAKAKDSLKQMEKAAESFDNVVELKEKIENIEKAANKSFQNLSLLSKEQKKQIEEIKEKINKMRVNGHPLGPNTHLTIKDFDISLVNNVETRVKRDLKNFKKDIQTEVDKKLVPHLEKEKKLEDLNQKVDDIVRVNSNVKKLRKQKSFTELYNQVVKDAKPKL